MRHRLHFYCSLWTDLIKIFKKVFYRTLLNADQNLLSTFFRFISYVFIMSQCRESKYVYRLLRVRLKGLDNGKYLLVVTLLITVDLLAIWFNIILDSYQHTSKSINQKAGKPNYCLRRYRRTFAPALSKHSLYTIFTVHCIAVMFGILMAKHNSCIFSLINSHWINHNNQIKLVNKCLLRIWSNILSFGLHVVRLAFQYFEHRRVS